MINSVCPTNEYTVWLSQHLPPLPQISEALDKVGVVSAVAPLVPDLVARLHTLKDLHERAAQFAGTVSFMSDSQEKLTSQIADLQSLLTQVTSNYVCIYVHVFI